MQILGSVAKQFQPWRKNLINAML